MNVTLLVINITVYVNMIMLFIQIILTYNPLRKKSRATNNKAVWFCVICLLNLLTDFLETCHSLHVSLQSPQLLILYLFIFSLFKNALRGSEYEALNDYVI
jgi:choline-glycine betaine transporter